MTDAILPLVEDVMSSPWIYLVLFALAAVDGFFPVVPSEASVITAGVFAAAGDPSLPLVILVAALGAFAAIRSPTRWAASRVPACTSARVPAVAGGRRWTAHALPSARAAA